MKSTINFGYLIFLSVVAALGGFLFGYDTAVISGTIAQVTQLFQLDALQQGWYVHRRFFFRTGRPLMHVQVEVIRSF